MYSIVLSIHVMAIISWMAGILYLLRLFVYHQMETEAVVKERFQLMETRLYKYITIPAMVVAYLMGISLLVMRADLLTLPWMHIKLFAVFLLTGVTHSSKRFMRTLADGTNTRSEKFFRIYNELPTILMIIIVVMVIVRPF